MNTDYLVAKGSFFLPPSTNIQSNMDDSVFGLMPFRPYNYSSNNSYIQPQIYSQPLLTPNEILRSFGLQPQTQNPRLRNCTPLEVMFGLCPPITPEESIEINTQEKIKQGIPETQARKDASDEALELKAKIPTMDQWMQKIFGVNYETVKFFLLVAIILFVVFLLKR